MCPIFVLCKQIYHLAKGSVPVRAMRDMRSWLKSKVYPGYLLESSPGELSHTQQTQNPIYKCYSVTQSCLTLCDPTDCSTPGFSVLHHLPEFAQTHVHWVDDAIQPSHPLSPPPHPALSLSQHQGLFQWVSSSHQVAKIGTLLGIVIVTDFFARRIFDYWLKMFADFILRFRLK